MPENAVYLQAALAITIFSLMIYVGYALVRLRQAQDDWHAAQTALQAPGRPASTGTPQGQPLRSAQEPPATR